MVCLFVNKGNAKGDQQKKGGKLSKSTQNVTVACSDHFRLVSILVLLPLSCMCLHVGPIDVTLYLLNSFSSGIPSHGFVKDVFN